MALHLKRTWRKGALQLASFFLQEGSQPNQSPKHWQGHTQTLTQEKTSRTGGFGGSSCPQTTLHICGVLTLREQPRSQDTTKKKKQADGAGEGASAPLPLFPWEPPGRGNDAAEKFGDRLQKASSELKAAAARGKNPVLRAAARPSRGQNPAERATCPNQRRLRSEPSKQHRRADGLQTNRASQKAPAEAAGGRNSPRWKEVVIWAGRGRNAVTFVKLIDEINYSWVIVCPALRMGEMQGKQHRGLGGSWRLQSPRKPRFWVGWDAHGKPCLVLSPGREQWRNNGGWGCPAGKRAPAGPTPARGRHGSIGARCHSGDVQGQHPACSAASSPPRGHTCCPQHPAGCPTPSPSPPRHPALGAPRF